MPELAGPEFYLPGAAELAPRILGMLLCRRMPDGSVLKLRVTETEAYCGESDTAAHAHHGRTPRTEVLYHRGGKAYVYRCYMFWLLNLTCGAEGDPQCVLIRGVDGFSGPGRMSKAMCIEKGLYGKDLVPENGLWLEYGDPPEGRIEAGPRVGIPHASEADRLAPLNFRLVRTSSEMLVIGDPVEQDVQQPEGPGRSDDGLRTGADEIPSGRLDDRLGQCRSPVHSGDAEPLAGEDDVALGMLRIV